MFWENHEIHLELDIHNLDSNSNSDTSGSFDSWVLLSILRFNLLLCKMRIKMSTVSGYF